MNTFMRVCVLGPSLLLLVACGQHAAASLQQADPGANVDLRTLIEQRDQAIQQAQRVASPVILRQVDTDFTTTAFRFTDSGATKEILVVVPDAGTPANQWEVRTQTASPLAGHVTPDLPLHELRVGPTRVANTIARQWPQCREPRATLYGDDRTLTWRMFCTLPAGAVAGEMDARSGTFTADAGGPVALPPTATPLPSH